MASENAKIIRCRQDSEPHYHEGSPVREIFAQCIELLKDNISRFGNPGIVFQADLLFASSSDSRVIKKQMS